MLRTARTDCPGRAFRRACLLSASMAVAGLSVFGSAMAQTLPPLRGEITEEQASRDLSLGRGNSARQGASPARTGSRARYEPTSPGALTETEEQAMRERSQSGMVADGSLDDTPSNPFAEAAPIPQPRPTTARDRDRQTEERLANNGKTPRPPASEAGQTDELATGTVREPKADTAERDELIVDRGAERTSAVEALEKRPEENPFEAVGIRVGTFILRPSVEQGVTYTTNANSSPRGREAVQSETTLRLNAMADWSQHRASLDAFGTFRKSVSGEDIDQKEGGVDATLDLDLSHEYKLKTALGYSFKPESASSPVMLGNVVEQPLRQTFDGSVGLSRELGKFEFGITGRAERNIYGDAELSGGGVLDQDERNSTLATVALRAGYEISPAVTPFAELEIGRRNYDEESDAAGYRRSADRLAARAGLALDLQEKLTGEFSAGWLRESFDDDRLDAISGLSLAANLRWSPERETTITLNASTSTEGTTTAGKSGSLLHSGRIALERKLRSNLSANAALGLDYRTYSGTGDHDLLLSGEIGATWWLNRYAGLTGRLRHEEQKSDLSDRDYKTQSVFVGVKVQR